MSGYDPEKHVFSVAVVYKKHDGATAIGSIPFEAMPEDPSSLMIGEGELAGLPEGTEIFTPGVHTRTIDRDTTTEITNELYVHSSKPMISTPVNTYMIGSRVCRVIHTLAEAKGEFVPHDYLIESAYGFKADLATNGLLRQAVSRSRGVLWGVFSVEGLAIPRDEIIIGGRGIGYSLLPGLSRAA